MTGPHKKISVLCMNNFFDSALHILGEQFKILYLNELNSTQDKSVEAILTTPWSTVNAELIAKFPNLKIISCFGVGIDVIDKKSALEKNITITNTPNVVTEDTADIAMALILAVARNLVFNDNYVRSGKWRHVPAPLGISLYGKTMGIVGLGNIGSKIAERAATFGLNIIYHARTKKDVAYSYYANLIEMAEHCNFLVIACPGGEETKNIINLNVLKALGKEGYLVNISRGSTVNEDDLLNALENNLIAGAGLDVYLNEPHIREDFFKFEQVVLLPHIGTATKETRAKMINLALNNIQSFFTQGQALTPVVLN